MHFTVTRAGLAPTLARALAAGQAEAMRLHGIARVLPGDSHPAGYLIAAEREPGVPVGGLRLERRTPTDPLPLERAWTQHPLVRRKLERRSAEGLVELCSLYVDADAPERDLATRLVRLSLGLARALGARHAVVFAGHHALPLAARTGFHPEPGEPVIPYPDRRYRSRIVWQRLETP